MGRDGRRLEERRQRGRGRGRHAEGHRGLPIREGAADRDGSGLLVLRGVPDRLCHLGQDRVSRRWQRWHGASSAFIPGHSGPAIFLASSTTTFPARSAEFDRTFLCAAGRLVWLRLVSVFVFCTGAVVARVWRCCFCVFRLWSRHPHPPEKPLFSSFSNFLGP